MTDFDSRDSTPALRTQRRGSRRQLYDDSEASTPRESSPDELANHKPHRSSRLSTRQETNLRRRAHSSDGSVDELDHTYHGRNRSRSRSSSAGSHRSSHSTPGPPTPPERKPLKTDYREKLLLTGHTGGVSQVRYSPDGKWIASCSADATIRIWDAATGKHLRTLEGHLAGISTIAWSPDSNTIASGSDDKTIRLWHRDSGKPYSAALHGHHNYVYSVAFSPKGNTLISGSFDEAVFLWDLRARREIRNFPAHSDPVGGVDFIYDGTLVCSCSTDGLIRVWDHTTGQCLRTIVHEDNAPVTTARFSPNGRYILAHTLDSCIRLWDYVSGTCKKTYQGHLNEKYSIGGAFGMSGSESFIVSGSEDGNIILWDVRNKEIVQKFGAHDGVVCWVDTSPGPASSIVSGGLDGTIRVWVDVASDGMMTDMNGLKLEEADVDMPAVKQERDDGFDTPRDEAARNGNSGHSQDNRRSRSRSRDRMDLD